MEEINLTNQERIRRLQEKKMYQYLVILKIDTFNKVAMEEKNIRLISDELENFSKPSPTTFIELK